MSIKRRVEYQYNRLYSAVQRVDFPSWMNALAFRFTMTSIVIVVSVFYVCKTSNLSTSGFVLRDLEDRVADLQTDIQKTEVDIALNSSISNLEGRLKDLNMVSLDKFSYITPSDSFVAKR